MKEFFGRKPKQWEIIRLKFLIFFFMLPTIALGEVDDQKLAALVFKEAEVYELQRDWQNALAYYKKAVDLNSIELYRYKAAYAATQCKPPRWDVAERLLSRNRKVDSLLLLVEISQRRKDWRKAHSLLKTEIQERLEKIVFQLYQTNGSSGTLPQVILLANNSRNAWSVPPNQLFVTVGLVKFIDNQPSLQPIADDVIAFILGHEWTHILHNDYERSEKIQLLMSGLVPQQSVSWIHLQSGLGRVAEVSADRQGLLFAYRAGYDPYAAIAWCEATIQEEGDWDSNGDHPSLRERKQLLLNLLEGPMRQAYQSFEQGVQAFQSSDLENATYAFETYLRLFPNDCAALENLSIVYFLRGVSLLKRTPWEPWRLEHDVQLEPDLSPFPTRIVKITAETRRWWNRAQRLAYILLRLNPKSPGGYQILGDIALSMGQAEKAEDMYQKGLTIEPSHGGLINNLGVLYARRGDNRRAQELWTSLPDSSTAKWNLKQ